MKILVVADEESKSLWDFYTPRKLKGIDLIISCGDLSPAYLEFLVCSMSAAITTRSMTESRRKAAYVSTR